MPRRGPGRDRLTTRTFSWSCDLLARTETSQAVCESRVTRQFVDHGLRVLRFTMLGPAKIYFIIFGILTIAGGIIGYVKAGSMPSIIAGSITGILLLVGAWMLPEHQVAGLLTVLIVSVLLAAQFVPKFIGTGKAMPAGMMSILSVIGDRKST